MALKIKRIDDISIDQLGAGKEDAMEQLSTLEWQAIAHSPWSESFPYQPEVRFQIGHSDQFIYLHYEVREEFMKAQYVRINENVWEDSCVEFFLSLDGKKTYYNVEFNVLGTGLVGYGPSVKTERNRLEAADTERISSFTRAYSVGGKKCWRLLLVIPKDIFVSDIPVDSVLHANFYKCGDGLPQPHFLSWKDIKNPTPNFHLPQYFGEIIFEN